MFSNWIKRAKTFVPQLYPWQERGVLRHLKKAYEAGRKQGRAEVQAKVRETT